MKSSSVVMIFVETSEKSSITVIPRSEATRNLSFQLKIKNEILHFVQNDKRQSIFQMSHIQSNLFFVFVVSIFTMVVLSGCSSTQQTIVDHSLSASEIIKSVNAQADSIQTFSAFGSINVETPTMNQSAGFDLAIKKPDSVRIIVEGPFGITVGKALFTKQHFVAYNAMNNTVYEGDLSHGMKRFPVMSAFPPEVLINALSGVRQFNYTTTEPDSFYLTDKFYVVVFLEKQTISKFQVDPNSMRISIAKTYKSTGELLREESYSYQQLKNGQWRPSTTKIVLSEKQVTLDISFDEITINEAIESMLITFPEDAERTTIQ